MPINLENIIQEKADIPGNIKEIDKFTTWWNPNCALVISEEKTSFYSSSKYSDFYLFLIVYEIPYRKVSEKFFQKKIERYNTWKNIKGMAEVTKKNLNNDKRPFWLCFLASGCNLHINPPKLFFEEGRIVEIEIKEINNPDDYLRPFDIVHRKSRFSGNFHVAVYLGDKKVCHIYNPEGSNGQRNLEEALARKNQIRFFLNNLANISASSSSYKEKEEDFTSEDLLARVDEWDRFLDEVQKVKGYHSIIPDKNPSLIIQHLKKSLQNDYGKGEYGLIKKNCEHFANLIIHGVNFSQQVGRYPCFALEEKEKFKKSFEENGDELTFKNLEVKRELTEEECQIFQQLENQIETPPK